MRYLLCSLVALFVLHSPGVFAQEGAPPFEIPRTEIREVISEYLGRTYEAYIKLPPGYHDTENAGRTYPVVYLTDGHIRFEIASAMTESPMAYGNMEHFIIVGMPPAKDENWTKSRVRDYTPSNVPPEQFENDPNYLNSGGASEYLQFLRDEFIPFIEENFRATPARRVYAGHSYGGLFGAFVLLEAPDTFRSYILGSPSFWYDDELIYKMEEAFAAEHSDLVADIYLSVGEFEEPSAIAYPPEFQGLLERRDYPSLRVKRETVALAYHNTAFPMILLRGLQWLFEPEASE